MNRKARRADKLHSIRVRVGIGYTDDGRYLAVVRIDHGALTDLYESEPYATEAEAEAHRVELSAGVRACLARGDMRFPGLRIAPVGKGGTA